MDVPLMVAPEIVAPDIVPVEMLAFPAMSVGTVSGPVSVPPLSAKTFENALFSCCAVRTWPVTNPGELWASAKFAPTVR
ncbi:hypothetical protein CO711_16980 [Burkholderia cepacia]|uniref:Uncharacterized protein n=1 Tax=Burkholderia cepacia TaxID=292 RepID=A0ABM6NVI6_BURCE|nr:hypothetical protein APZ15_12010 [Burkholderia cepacia ATCC 25416]ATF78945.1 hypothetical protein CO711_16980 [Burkholderia cepacia]